MEVLRHKQRVGKVLSNLATVFLFVTLLGKQSPSQEGFGIGRQKFKGDAGVMGCKRQEAGGDLVGTGLLLSPAVLAMSPLTEGQPQVRRPTKKKGKREMRGFKCRPDRRSLEEGWSLCT